MHQIPMPTDRNSLAFLYALCARAEGVRPTFDAEGRHVGFTGPQIALDRYAARMRRIQPGRPLRPKRSVRRRAQKQKGTTNGG